MERFLQRYLSDRFMPVLEADGGAAGGGNEQGDKEAAQGQEEAKETYTREEVEALLQAEADRRVAQALKKNERKTEKRIKEAERLAAMNEEERYSYEIEQREKAIAEKEAALRIQENKVEALKIMGEKGVPASLVDFIVREDADDTLANINLFDKEIKKAVAEEVKKRLGGSAPGTGAGGAMDVTPEAYKKMSIADRAALYQTNKELYEKLERGI